MSAIPAQMWVHRLWLVHICCFLLLCEEDEKHTNGVTVSFPRSVRCACDEGHGAIFRHVTWSWHVWARDLCAPARYGKNPQAQCKFELIFCMGKGAFCHFPPLPTAIESYSLLLPRGSHSCTDMGYSGFSLSLFVISCCIGRKKKTAPMLL